MATKKTVKKYQTGNFIFKSDAESFVKSVIRRGGEAKILRTIPRQYTIVKYKR